MAKRNYSKISLILLDHDSISFRHFITWSNEKKVFLYGTKKHIFFNSQTFSEQAALTDFQMHFRNKDRNAK